MSTIPRLAPGPYLASSTVSTQWLADHLGADNLTIVAAPAHVRLLVLELDKATTTVIVHDATGGPCSVELAMRLRAVGFERVAVLTGGRTKWNVEERPGDLAALSHPVHGSSLHPGHVEPRLA